MYDSMIFLNNLQIIRYPYEKQLPDVKLPYVNFKLMSRRGTRAYPLSLFWPVALSPESSAASGAGSCQR